MSTITTTNSSQLEAKILASGSPVKAASKELGAHVETVRVLCRTGRIKAQFVLGRLWLIPASEIKRLAAQRRVVSTRGRRKYTFWPSEVTK